MCAKFKRDAGTLKQEGRLPTTGSGEWTLGKKSGRGTISTGADTGTLWGKHQSTRLGRGHWERMTHRSFPGC